MTNVLIDKFKCLPDEIIHSIINYTDVVVYRHGKFINRLNKEDKRYKLVNKISRPIKIGLHKVLIRLTDVNENKKGYFIEYYTSYDLIKVNIRFFYKEKDGFDTYYDIKSDDTYIFDANNRLSKIIHYLM